jgi:hypothetical protein
VVTGTIRVKEDAAECMGESLSLRPAKGWIAPSAGGKVEVNVLGVSARGIAFIDHGGQIALDLGNTFPFCRLWLPGEGAVEVTLQVRALRELALENAHIVDSARGAESRTDAQHKKARQEITTGCYPQQS